MLAVLCLASPCMAQGRLRRVPVAGGGTVAGVATVLPSVTLTTPIDGAVDRPITVSLNYTLSGGTPDLCTLYIDSVSVATDATCDGSFTSDDYSGPLDYETEYTFTVKAENAAGSHTPAVHTFTTAVMGALSLLTVSDLTCEGMFLTPNNGTGAWSVTFPMALQSVGATRRYHQINGDDGHIRSFDEPAMLSPCNTAVASIVSATYDTDWGQYPSVHTAGNYAPPSYGTVYGLDWDEARGYLWMGFLADYTNIPPGNSFAAATFNSDHLDLVGCWGLNTRSDTVGQAHGGSGVVTIPDWFVDAYLPAGANIGVGMGGRLASGGTSPNSFGPSIEAIPMPAGNACPTDTNTFLSAGTVLMRYASAPSADGPTCYGLGLGCDTSMRTPTGPPPAQMGHCNLSQDAYAIDWDPYGGHCFWSSWVSAAGNWYDDGSKTGIIYTMHVPEGWALQTVLASPAPTVSYPNVTFSITDCSTHDGHCVQAGDVIWVKTCTVGVDSGCITDNNDDESFVVVDTVTGSGPYAIAGHISDGDVGAGDHKPVVGGAVKHGVVYAHGGPRESRQTLLMQIYDPADLAAASMNDPDDPVYAEEIDLTTIVPQFGCAGCALPGIPIYWGQPSGVKVDPDNHKIVLFFRNAVIGIGATKALGVVFDVAH